MGDARFAGQSAHGTKHRTRARRWAGAGLALAGLVMLVATAMWSRPQVPEAASAVPVPASAETTTGPATERTIPTAAGLAAGPPLAPAGLPEPRPLPPPVNPLLSLAGLPQISADERAALRAELVGHADPERELARVLDYLAFDAAFRHWRELADAKAGAAAGAEDRARQAALATALAAELDTRLARRELTAAEVSAARRMLLDSRLP